MNEQSRTPRRPRLNRERVLAAAVRLADEGGVEALSMRKLAEQLGVVPMALYKHVADKDELLDMMVDAVFAEADFAPGPGWRSAMRDRAVAMREALRRHPWAVGRMESGTPGPANLRHHNAVMACLRRDAGFPFDLAVHAYSVLDSYIYGFALQERALAGDIPAEASRRRDAVTAVDPDLAAELPYLLEVVEELGRSGYDHGQEYEFGLDLILDGIERLRRQRARKGGATAGHRHDRPD